MESSKSWQSRAACKGLTEYFFAAPAEMPQSKQIREAIAKSICDSCPVIDSCLEYISDNVEHGYWAGMSEDDRSFRGFMVDRQSLSRSEVNRLRRQAS